MISAQRDHIISAPRDHMISAPRNHMISAPRDHMISTPRDHMISAQRDHIIYAQRDHMISAQRDHMISAQRDEVCLWFEPGVSNFVERYSTSRCGHKRYYRRMYQIVFLETLFTIRLDIVHCKPPTVVWKKYMYNSLCNFVRIHLSISRFMCVICIRFN